MNPNTSGMPRTCPFPDLGLANKLVTSNKFCLERNLPSLSYSGNRIQVFTKTFVDDRNPDELDVDDGTAGLDRLDCLYTV